MTHSTRLLVVFTVTGGCLDPDPEWRKGPAGGGPDDNAVDVTQAGSGSDGSGSGSDGSGSGSGSDGSGSDSDDTAAPVDPFGDGELRGAWVTRWSYSNAADVDTVLGELADAGFEHVFFQVRGNFDAYYDSAVEPWAARLTGTLGQDPGWDPLQAAIDSGHARGLQIHAYINVFPFWTGTTPPAAATPAHAYSTHPEWVVHDESGTPMALNSSYVYASPGNPAVQEHIGAVVADIADHYDVDGIHLDYIRYPGSQYSSDPASLAAYGADTRGLSWDDWRRDQVLQTVEAARLATGLPLTAAVWGIYEDRWGWGVSQGNVDYMQDSRAMLQAGLVDAIIPMIYWPVTATEGDRLDFRTLVRDHLTARSSGGRVFAGFGNTVSTDEALDCVRVAREEGADGVVLFDWSVYRADLGRFGTEVFAE